MPIVELSIGREWERHNGWFAKTTFVRESPCWAGMCIGLVYAIYTKYIYIYVYLYTARLYAYIYIHIHTCLYKCIAFSPVKELPMTLPGDLLAHPVDEHMYIYIHGPESTVRLGIFQHARPFNCFSWLVDDGLLCLKPQNGGQFWADSSYWQLNQTTSLNWSPVVLQFNQNSASIFEILQSLGCSHMLPLQDASDKWVFSSAFPGKKTPTGSQVLGGVAPPARHYCGNWGIDSCNWSVKVVYLDKGSPGLAVAGPIWYSARLEKTKKKH